MRHVLKAGGLRLVEWRKVLPRMALAIGLCSVLVCVGPGGSAVATSDDAAFSRAVRAILALPYQPAYVPAGLDSAFPGQNVANDYPVEDYTSGSIPGNPDHPSWPAVFKQVTFPSQDGTTLIGELALLPGHHPAVLVVHGFDTHGIESVIRWAAMLAVNGYDVLAADQRDFYWEYNAGYGYPNNLQTLGWKESQDVLAGGQFLAAQPGVTSVGVVGFSEGAQNTVLALSQDRSHIFSAGITFSGPADQDTQIYSTAQPPNCQSPNCTYPATDALIAVVVPPYGHYNDPCTVLSDAGAYYGVTPYSILTHETAMHAQTAVAVPLLNFYSADDSLVSPVNAQLMSAYEQGNPLQRTIEIQHGEHAYFYDRWWQQVAILTYFHRLLPTGHRAQVAATVNQMAGGMPLSSQIVNFQVPTRPQADSMLAPYICDTSQPPPGNQ